MEYNEYEEAKCNEMNSREFTNFLMEIVKYLRNILFYYYYFISGNLSKVRPFRPILAE